MKRFYLYDKKTQTTTPLKVEISPTLVETLDESLDNMTINLLISNNEKPLSPRRYEVHFYNYDESTETQTLIQKLMISADNVELAGVNNNIYKHTVSLIQRSQDLTKNLIRNNVFDFFETNNYVIGGSALMQLRELVGQDQPEIIGYDYINGRIPLLELEIKSRIKSFTITPSFMAQLADYPTREELGGESSPEVYTIYYLNQQPSIRF